jgi:hypothetical protein
VLQILIGRIQPTARRSWSSPSCASERTGQDPKDCENVRQVQECEYCRGREAIERPVIRLVSLSSQTRATGTLANRYVSTRRGRGQNNRDPIVRLRRPRPPPCWQRECSALSKAQPGISADPMGDAILELSAQNSRVRYSFTSLLEARLVRTRPRGTDG